jgi:predicted ArsR family transcriptional regulator
MSVEGQQRPRTLADHRSLKNNSPSVRERKAMALLFQDDWSVGELAMVFECQKQTVRRNLKFEGAWR